MGNFGWEIIFILALGKELHHLKKPLGRKANERLVTLGTVFKGITILTSRFLNCLKPPKIRKLHGGWAVKPTALHPRIINELKENLVRLIYFVANKQQTSGVVVLDRK